MEFQDPEHNRTVAPEHLCRASTLKYFAWLEPIIERGGKFLLVRENQPKHPDHGKWNQPAGWIDVEENPIAAVKREAREETGYEFTPTHLLSVSSLVRKDQTKHFGAMPHALKLIFIGSISADAGEIEDDISETRWFTPEEIDTMDVKTLRDTDIKRLVRNYLAGVRYPIEILHHTVAE